MARYEDLMEKVVLLTGGANGIGAATVRAFSRQGATVLFCDRDKEAGLVLETEVPNSKFTRVDLRNEGEVVRWIGKAKKDWARIDVLVNNAAIDPRIPLEELTTAKLEELFEINLRAFFITSRESV